VRWRVFDRLACCCSSCAWGESEWLGRLRKLSGKCNTSGVAVLRTREANRRQGISASGAAQENGTVSRRTRKSQEKAGSTAQRPPPTHTLHPHNPHVHSRLQMRTSTLAMLAATAGRGNTARSLLHSSCASSSALALASGAAPSSSSLLAVSQQRAVSTVFRRERVNPVERPVSPHVSIYQFPLPALISITHRACGVSLAAGLCSSQKSLLGAFDRQGVLVVVVVWLCCCCE
jgi:Succinate dehydrogenase/Fumarate reductase transmembrane subunit